MINQLVADPNYVAAGLDADGILHVDGVLDGETAQSIHLTIPRLVRLFPHPVRLWPLIIRLHPRIIEFVPMVTKGAPERNEPGGATVVDYGLERLLEGGSVEFHKQWDDELLEEELIPDGDGGAVDGCAPITRVGQFRHWWEGRFCVMLSKMIILFSPSESTLVTGYSWPSTK